MNIYYTFIKYCNRFLRTIRTHFVLFCFSLFLGLGPFIFLYVIDKNKFTASFTVVYDELARKVYGDRIQKLNMLVRQNQDKKISELLRVDYKTASALLDVQGKNILGEELSKDMNTDRIPFIIKLTVNDSSTIRNLQKGIVDFLDIGNEYLLTRKTLKLAEVDDELNFINDQLSLMDSLKRKNYNESINFNKEDKDKKTVNSQGSLFDFSYEMYKKKQELLKKQKMPAGVQVIDDAFVSANAGKPLLLMLAVGAICGLLVFVLMIGFVLPVANYRD